MKNLKDRVRDLEESNTNLRVILAIACLLFVVVIIGLFSLTNEDTMTHTEYFTLDNSNNFIDAKIVEYTCSDNVHVEESLFRNYLYISTWDKDANGDIGDCLVKMEG